MKHFRFPLQIPFAFAIAVTVTIGCSAGPGDGSDRGVEGADAGSEGEVTVNGVPASEYYGQFVWETTSTHVGGAAAFAEVNERNAFILDFFLLEDGSYIAFYGEGTGEVSATGHNLGIYPDSYTRREGTWSVEGADLVLASLASCGGFTYNDKEVLRCELTETVVTPEAVGASGVFSLDFGESSPFDSEWSKYK